MINYRNKKQKMRQLFCKQRLKCYENCKSMSYRVYSLRPRRVKNQNAIIFWSFLQVIAVTKTLLKFSLKKPKIWGSFIENNTSALKVLITLFLQKNTFCAGVFVKRDDGSTFISNSNEITSLVNSATRKNRCFKKTGILNQSNSDVSSNELALVSKKDSGSPFFSNSNEFTSINWSLKEKLLIKTKSAQLYCRTIMRSRQKHNCKTTTERQSTI